MKHLLPLLLLVACSCASHRPRAAAPVASVPIAVPVAPVVPVIPVAPVPHRSLLDKVLNRTPSTSSIKSGAELPKVGKCKGCTINVAYGNQQNQQVDKKGMLQGDGSSNIDKNKGTSGTGSGTVTNQPGATNAAVTQGNNNTTKQTTIPPAPKLTAWQRFKDGAAAAWSAAKAPLIGLLVIGLVTGGIYLFAPASGAALFLAGLFKRKKSTDTTTI